MWDPSKGKGFLYYKFKNERCDAKILETVRGNSPVEIELSDTENDGLIIFFKTCVLPDDKATLLNKLDETILFRTNLLKDMRKNFTEFFPFYFVHPDIVS